jgi:hypothetical protein
VEWVTPKSGWKTVRQSGNWAIGQLGNWAVGQLGSWAIGQLGSWAVGQLGSFRLEGIRVLFLAKFFVKKCGPIFWRSSPHQNLAHSVFGI